MNKIWILGLLFSVLVLQGFEAANHEADCETVPHLNNGIIEYTATQMNKKVGRGECWDLAAEALRTVNAKWDGMYVYGRRIDPEKECVFPGDIIQFKNVEIITTTANSKIKEMMPHHTAIVYKVNGRGDYEIAHQNYGPWGRKVGVSSLVLKNITKGKISVYRPEK